MHIAASNDISLLVIKFRIRGNLIFLSHAEMLKVFQRACVRAGISVRYSQGFNPRPKLSLPLPRPVGVESDDELLCLQVSRDSCLDPLTSGEPQVVENQLQIKTDLSGQLPEGCELLSVSIAEANTSFQPCSATYILAVRKEYLNEKLKATIKHLLASKSLSVRRQIGVKDSRFKNLDVRDFLKSIELVDRGIIVEYIISSAGSIRVEEVLELLELDTGKLAAPVKRTNVQWQVSES